MVRVDYMHLELLGQREVNLLEDMNSKQSIYYSRAPCFFFPTVAAIAMLDVLDILEESLGR